jgi:hypothetical protein
MAKTVGLKIEIEGLSTITENVVQLERALKETKAQAKDLEKEIQGLNEQIEASDNAEEVEKLNKQLAIAEQEYIGLRNTIADTNEQLKGARKEQRDFIKQANTAKFKKGSYFDLNEQLKAARKSFKNLSEEERKGQIGQQLTARIQKLDKELKGIDKSIGQNQRNVGNYSKALDNLVPGFRRISKAVTNANGKLNIFGKALVAGFVAFKAAQFIAKAVKQIDEFVEKIDETRQAVAGLSEASGEELEKLTANTQALAETFDVSSDQITKSARALADSLGIGFDEALEKIEGRLVEGVANNEEFLRSVEELPEAFDEASGAVTEFSERNGQLLARNKELAESQVNVAKRLQGVTDTFKNISATVQTVLFKVLADLIDIFRPVVSAFQRAGEAVGRLFKSFAAFRKEGEESITISSLISGNFQRLAGVLQFVADGITFVVDGITDLIQNVPLLQKLFAFIFDQVAKVRQVFTDLPFIFAGVIAALKQLGTNFVNFFEATFIDAQIFAAKVKGIFSSAAQAQIEELRKRRKELIADGGSVGEAYSEAFNAARKKAEDEAEAARLEDQKKADIKALEAKTKRDLEAFKKQRDAAKKAAEQLQKDRDKFAQDELKKAQQRAALLADLNARLVDQRIKAIEDEGKRREEEIQLNFKRQRQALIDGNKKLVDEQKAREAELVKIFGEGSKEVLESRAQFQKEFAQIEEQTAAIIQTLKEEEARELGALQDDINAKDIQKAKAAAAELRAFRDQALSEELAFIDLQARQRELAAQESLNRLLIQEEDAASRAEAIRLDAERQIVDKILDVRNKLQALQDQEDFLRSEAEAGVKIKEEEYAAILQARQELETELTALELQQTETVRANANAQLEAFNQAFGQIADVAGKGLTAFDNVLDSLDSRQEAQLEQSLTRSQERQAQLEAEAENATGLRKKFLEQQADNEIQTQKALDAQKEDLAKRSAKRDKAISITESLIQGLLAVTRAAAAPPGFPLNLPSVIAVGALSAANTAAIAAKKFQDGGLIVGKPHSQGGVKFAVGGQVGFEAEGGEYIVNKRATAKNLPLLQRINSQKFAEGGFIGGVAPTPTITNINTVQADSVQALAGSLAQVINSQEVILVTDDLDEDRDNQERIKKRTILR